MGLALVAVMLAGCGAPAASVAPSGSEGAPGSAPALTGDPVQGGTLIVGRTGEPPTLDPLVETSIAWEIMGHVYDKLVMYDRDLKIVGSLADSWEEAADGLSVTFKLRPGVKFANGRDLTADDVKYSFEQLMSEGSAHARLYVTVASIDAPAADTVVFNLKAPEAHSLLVSLTLFASVVFPKELVEENGDLKKVALGTGPFQLKEWKSGDSITLTRNPHYWKEGLPHVDELVFKIYPEPSSIVAALRANQVNWATFDDPAVVAQVANDPAIQHIEAGFIGNVYMAMNMARSPFSDPRVRQAIGFAVDRQEILDVAVQGLGTLTGPIVPAVKDVALDVAEYPSYTRDVEKAKSLLAEAGFPNGFSTTISVSSASPTLVAAAVSIADQLSAIGVTAEIKTLESGVWIEELQKHTYDMSVANTGGYPDPDLPMTNSYTCEGVFNWSGICDQSFDALITEAKQATGDVRREKYAEAQRRLVNELVPYLWLYVPNQQFAMTKNVQGFDPYPVWTFPLHEVWLAD